MIRAQIGADTVTFAYDAFGRRTKKSSSAGTVSYIYDGDQVIAEYNASGALLRKFVYGSGIDEPVLMESSGTQYYYHFDGLGSVREISNAAGAVVEKYAYDVYGKMRISNASDTVLEKSAVGNPYSFTGRRYDTETGLYHYRARTYSAELGRFLQVDPVGYMDSMNLYAYVLNNPVNLIDPFGNRSDQHGKGPLSGNDPIIEEIMEIAPDDPKKAKQKAEDLIKELENQKQKAKRNKCGKEVKKIENRLKHLRGISKVISRFFKLFPIFIPPQDCTIIPCEGHLEA
jgi:RHS repeat-associated protein